MAVMVALPMCHNCLIFTAIGSLVWGGLPHQGAVLANVKQVWYYVHMMAIKSSLRRVFTKFAMLMRCWGDGGIRLCRGEVHDREDCVIVCCLLFL